jgi:hypothetical protein
VYFEDPADIPGFKVAVEKHAFLTDRGAQYRGIVQYAPFQKIPEGKVKRDPREGTLEQGAALSLDWDWHDVVPTMRSIVLGSAWHVSLVMNEFTDSSAWWVRQKHYCAIYSQIHPIQMLLHCRS